MEVIKFMKKSSSKKFFALLLSAIMLVTSIPFAALTVMAANTDLSSLTAAMAAYEGKMDGTVYQNMKPAYDAYVKANQAYDAIVYGDTKTAIDVNALASDLTNKTNDLTPWTPATGNVTAAADGSYEKSSLANNQRMSNILYTYGVGSTSSHATIAHDRRGVQFGSIVFLYDGINDCICPVNVYKYKSNQGQTLETAYVTTDGLTTNTYWYGVRTSAGYCSDSSYRVRYEGNGADGQNYNHQAGSATYYFTGMIQYTGGENGFSNYLRKFDSTDWHMSYISTKVFGGYNTNESAGDGSFSTPIYVVNYKALIDAVDSTKVPANVENYKEGGISAWISAIDNATSYDPNSDFAGITTDTSNLENAVNNCSNNIANKISAVNNVTAKADSVYEPLREAIQKYASIEENPCFSKAFLSTYEAALANARAAMANVYDVNSYTDKYNNTSIQDIAKALGDAVADLSKPENMVHSIYKFAHFDDANKDLGWFNCAVDFDNHIDVVSADLSAYNALAMVYSTLDVAKYDNAADIREAYDAFSTLDNEETSNPEALINARISNLLNAVNENNSSENKKQYNVTFKVVVDGVENTVFADESVDYGKIKDIIVPSEYQAENVVSKSWVVTFEDNNTSKAMTVDAYSYPLLVQQNTTITAYLSTDANVITILNQYGNVMYQFPSNGQEITFEGNDVIIDGKSYNVPNMPYMPVTGFTVNGNPAETIIADSPIVICPVFENTADVTYAITMDGVTIADDVKYDQRIKVTSENADAKGIAVFEDGKYSIVSYSNAYSFYANRSMNFYTVVTEDSKYTVNGTVITDPLDIYSLDNSLPFVYSAGAITPDGKFTTFSSFTKAIPADVTVIEVGTIYSRDNLGEADFKLNNDNDAVYQSVSKGQVDFSNQYSLTMSANTLAKGTVYTRAYVKYTYNYNGTEITAIAYGNICSSDITGA
ncbi:MAG: hypothetical protein K2H13_03270 [Eubacterium sp.]|nr:hypothetical protein [Eubacterium sp.]